MSRFRSRTDEMGSSIQQYCLRWNNHRSNLLLVFEHLFQTEAFTDVTLACDGESIKCHKMVLAACSSYFQLLFMENTCRHPIVILKDIRESEIRAILEYMYKGEVNVAQDQLAGLLKAAETLKVKGLVEDNNQRVSSTPTPTPPHQSSSPYLHQPPQVPVTATSLSTASSSALHHQEERHYYSSVGNTNIQYPSSTTKSNCIPPSKFIANDSPSSLYDSPYSHNVINSTTASSTTPERNALSFPVWSNRLNLSPKHSILGGSGNIGNSSNSSNVIQSTSSLSNNNSMTTSNSYEREQSEPVPLKKKRFMMSSVSSSSSIIAQNKDTPILRTVLGHTASLSGSNSSVTQQEPHVKTITYPFTPTITTNGPVDTNEIRMERERDRDRESPVDSYMEESVRSLDSDKGHDDNHPFNMESDEKKAISGLAMYVPSQKPEWKRYKQYTRNDILAAIDAVKDGMSALQAARKFGVPSRTLYDKVKKLGITTNRPYRKGSFPMSPYHGMNIKDENSSFSPEDLPLDISSTGNGLGHDMSIHGHEGDSDKVDSDPGSSGVKRDSPPIDFKDEFIREERERPENGSGKCSSTPPREREPMEADEIIRSHSE